jgi:hypothetical protein
VVVTLVFKAPEGNDGVAEISKENLSNLDLTNTLNNLHGSAPEYEQDGAQRDQEFGT